MFGKKRRADELLSMPLTDQDRLKEAESQLNQHQQRVNALRLEMLLWHKKYKPILDDLGQLVGILDAQYPELAVANEYNELRRRMNSVLNEFHQRLAVWAEVKQAVMMSS
jgi:hypothetical protein